MIREASDLPSGGIERDVCVIGAGAAGITLALTLARQGLSVCLLESGGDGIQTPVQSLYRGAAGAEAFHGQDDYAWSSRLRFLGGTTNHWRGECEPLGAAQFAARDWVAHSGWPFAAAELEAATAAAADWLELSQASAAEPGSDTPGFEPTPRRWSPPTRFGARYRDELASSENLLLLLRANAVALHANASGERIESVEVAAHLGATRFHVRAAEFVLAAGALENPRLLLASPTQPGNRHDRVGRYFMDGLEGQVALLLWLRDDTAGTIDERNRPALAPTPELQRERSLLDTRFVLELVPANPTGLVRSLGALASSIANAAQRVAPADRERPRLHRVIIGTEMAPNPENRVLLSEQRDALGVPKLALHAKPGDVERASVLAATRQFGASVGAALSGRLHLKLTPDNALAGLRASQHPSGTTRMHSDPKQGVVDADCRVHGVGNLFVAGSSVFPNSGHARPTWTLLALALRLAKHIVQRRKDLQ